MYLERYFKDLLANCCENHIYCIIFHPDGRALKLDGDWNLDDYELSNHDDCAIDMAEHATRTKLYIASLSDSDITLPDTNDGEFYTVEFWKSSGLRPFVRATSSLLDTCSLSRIDGTFYNPEVRITRSQVATLKKKLCHVAMALKPETSKMEVTCFVEEDGVLIVDPSLAVVTLTAPDGTVVANSSSDAPTNGIFAWEVSNISLFPDTIYTVKTKITLADDSEHSSYSTLTVWD